MRKIQFYVELAVILISTIVQTMPTASAVNLDLSSTPLFLANSVPPNILIIMDNSTSTDDEVLTKPHWERAAYEYNYASGPSHTPTDKDITEGHQLATCSDPDGDCGILRQDGTITLSGPELANAKGCTDPIKCDPKVAGNFTRNYLSYEYLSSCYGSTAPCCKPGFLGAGCNDDNYYNSTCTLASANHFSLANCPATEALDWRVRSAAVNVLYYNPNSGYPLKPGHLLQAERKVPARTPALPGSDCPALSG